MFRSKFDGRFLAEPGQLAFSSAGLFELLVFVRLSLAIRIMVTD